MLHKKGKSKIILTSSLKVSENVRNATNLAPCIVDYAVNFGIRNMETQWRKNLLENDDLHLPVKLSNCEII